MVVNKKLFFFVGFAAGLWQGCFALTVLDVVQASVLVHPSVQSQKAQLAVAMTDVRTAQQQFYPTPSVSLEQVKGSAADASFGAQSTVHAMRLQQPLWTGGRLTASLEKAQANAQAASEGLVDVRQQMAHRAVQAWVEWRAAVMRLQAQTRSVDAHMRLLDVVKRRAAEGAMAPSELYLTQTRLDQALAQAQTFQAQQRVARLKVSQLIGRGLMPDEQPSLSALPVACDVNNLHERALEVSGALRKLRAQQEAARQEVQERRADLSPEVYLRLERQRAPLSYGAGAVTNDRVYLGLSSRFGAGLSSWTAVEALEKKQDVLRAEYEAVQRNILEAVQSEQEQQASTAARLPYLQNAMVASAQTAQAWDRQFQAGKRSWVEVMNAAREMAQAEIDWSDATAAQIGSAWRMSIYCGDQQDLMNAVDVANAQEARP